MKVAIVTGAARGIGAACVEAFRGAGYKVVAVDRDGCDGDEVVHGDVADRATSDDAVRSRWSASAASTTLSETRATPSAS